MVYKEQAKPLPKLTESGCVEWVGHRDAKGYGRLHVRRDERWVSVKAHRLFYEVYRGAIPNGVGVLHSCDNRACVNLEHLYLGTQKRNMEDCARRGRVSSRKLTPSEVSLIRSMRGSNRLLAGFFNVSASTVSRVRTWRTYTVVE